MTVQGFLHQLTRENARRVLIVTTVELSHFGRRMKFLQDATYRRNLKSKKTASPGCGLYPPRSASFWSLLARLIT
jgi:hypothetical protein